MFADKKVLGIDIGTRYIKFALVKQGGKPEVVASAIVPTPAGCIRDGLIMDLQALSEKLKSVISENNLMAKKVAVNINSSSIVVRELLLAALKDDEIQPAVQFELSQSFPHMIQTHATAFKIYSRTSDSLTGITTSCPKEIVEEYKKLSEKAGIPIKYIDVNANSLAKAYNHFIMPPGIGDSVLLVDISYSMSQVNVLLDGKLILSRNISAGGAFVDSLIVNRFDISMEEAEGARRNGYLNLSISQEELDSCMRLGYSAVEEQIRQTLDFISYNKFQDGIKSICLTGGGCNFLGLGTYFSNSFKIPVHIAQSKNTSLEVSDTFFILMPAIGAALRED
ncbi:MAG: type IV pilus assembly protein PilM [Desulfosporosinus sp.]|nr:type IV pilus assembly protein PilM [Desulfosporosinus sp.]